MSLRDKVGLPLPNHCLLSQAVIWIAKFEVPIPYDHYVTLQDWIKLDDELYDEPKKALFLALMSGRIQATGHYQKVDFEQESSYALSRRNAWENFFESNPPGKITKNVPIDPNLWEWDLVNWNSYCLISPRLLDVAARFLTVSVPTKELFEIFPAPADEISEEVDTSSLSRRGPKPRYDWSAFYAEIAVRADLDSLPETAAELQRAMAEWCLDAWGKEPSETMLKEKIAPIYRHPRKRESR